MSGLADRDPIVVELRKERMRQGISQHELARRIGYATHGPLQQMEIGNRSCKLSVLRRWARALGRDLALTPPQDEVPSR